MFKAEELYSQYKSGIMFPPIGEAVKNMRLRPERVKTLKDLMISTNKISNHR